jgi:NADH-quinone oxidoreductase subunit H
MKGLILLFTLPAVAMAGLGTVLVLVLGAALPWLAAHRGMGWMLDPWFQALLKMLLLILVVVMPIASLLTWVERKQSAMMQDRVGPNRAAIGPVRAWGIIHFIADAVKMIMKEDFIPAKANRFLYTLAPLMAIVPVFIIFAIIPFGSDICAGHLWEVVPDVATCSGTKVQMQVARLDVGLLFYFAIASLAAYGTTLAGWSSYNKLALLGGLRASSQMISYEVTMGLSIMGAFLVYGTLEPYGLASAQGPNLLRWGFITQPLACVLFFCAAVAETKRAPFDTPEGESEIVGYFVEYSGMRFGTFFLAEFVEIVFLGMLMSTVFFGGYHVPFLHADGFHLLGHTLALPHVLVLIVGTTVFGLKVVFFCWLQMLIRWTLPRVRPDQLMSFGWKQLLPLSIANVVLTAIVVLFLMARGH